jgi:hypothetical protein
MTQNNSLKSDSIDSLRRRSDNLHPNGDGPRTNSEQACTSLLIVTP